MSKSYRPIIVLDDDPTGSQTVYNVPILTSWSVSALNQEFIEKTPLFFILTNTRARLAQEAEDINTTIGETLRSLDQKFWLISRGDSTLRGHFPNEILALVKGLGWGEDYLIVLIPAFIEGNRFTKNDIHYVVQKGTWIPVGESPYAQDKTFGYHSSNLIEFVIEKSKNTIEKNEISTISIEQLEQGAMQEIVEAIYETKSVLIVNATIQKHLDLFATIIHKIDRNIVFRTAASFVTALGEIPKRPLMDNAKMMVDGANGGGGLIIVGSHVPLATSQFNILKQSGIDNQEFEIRRFIKEGKSYLDHFSKKVNEKLLKGQDLVIYTSRGVVFKKSTEESLELSVKISEGLVEVVSNLKTPPPFIIAKGGITSADIATKGLKVKRAVVLGQIIPGVSVWQLDSDAKFSKSIFVVFPGNVGDEDDLLNVYLKIKR